MKYFDLAIFSILGYFGWFSRGWKGRYHETDIFLRSKISIITLCVCAYVSNVSWQLFAMLYKFDFIKLFTCFFTCLINPPQNSILCIGRCLQCRPLIGCSENAPNWLVTSSFCMIYRFLGGFPHAFTGPKSPQWSPEEGFWKDFQN